MLCDDSVYNAAMAFASLSFLLSSLVHMPYSLCRVLIISTPAYHRGCIKIRKTDRKMDQPGPDITSNDMDSHGEEGASHISSGGGKESRLEFE